MLYRSQYLFLGEIFMAECKIFYTRNMDCARFQEIVATYYQSLLTSPTNAANVPPAVTDRPCAWKNARGCACSNISTHFDSIFRDKVKYFKKITQVTVDNVVLRVDDL